MNLKQLLGICEHKWKLLSTNKILQERKYIIGCVYNLQCEKCGEIKFTSKNV